MKIGHHAKAIAHTKSSRWLRNLNSKKHVTIHSTNHLGFFCAKNRSKKKKIFEKWEHFENRPSCKGYSPCKILTLAQKLKFQTTCQNPFHKSFRVFLYKNRAKKDEIFEKWEHFENRPSCKGYSPCKILTLAQKLKFQKTCQNPFHKSFRVFLYKNRAKKDEIFEKWEHFENRPSCKGYSPCKILTLAQKLKFQKRYQNPFYKSFRDFLCKKTALKKTKYSRNESILKISHHAKAIAHAKSSLWLKN